LRLGRFIRLCVLATFVTTTLAHGQAKKPEDPAAALKRQGDEAMDALRYDDAIALYTRAYELNGMPAVLYNRGRVYQARGQYVKALDDIDRFAREATPELRARVPDLEAIRNELRSHIATVSIAANVAGARVLVRNVDVGTTPLAQPLQLDAGKARLEVRADGHEPHSEEVELAGGRETALAVSLVPVVQHGVLVVRAANEPGDVTIDGKPMGRAPVEAELAPGTHRIVMHKDGYEDASTSAVLSAGEKKDVVVRLESKPTIFGRWWFWAGASAIVAGGVVLSIALLTERSPDRGDGFAPEQARAPLVRW
jgi:hypothetical protein